jgi:hypothetical protein
MSSPRRGSVSHAPDAYGANDANDVNDVNVEGNERALDRDVTPAHIPDVDVSSVEDMYESPRAGAARLDDAVRDRAYFLFLERDGADGDPDADWYRAERELSEGAPLGGALDAGA